MRNTSIKAISTALGLWLFRPVMAPATPVSLPKPFYISEAQVRLYAAPSDRSKIRGYLSYSTPVSLVEQKGPWYHVRTVESKVGVQGWLKGHWLSATKIPAQPFIHSTHRYALNYPDKGVRFQPVDEDTLYLKVDPREPLAVIGIQIGYSTQTDLEKVVKTHPLSLAFQHQQLEEEGLTGLLFIREQKKMILNGQPTWYTHFYLHSHPLPAVGITPKKPISTLEGRQYMLFKNGKIFSLTVVAPHTKYQAWMVSFEKAVRSFRVP